MTRVREGYDRFGEHGNHAESSVAFVMANLSCIGSSSEAFWTELFDGMDAYD